MTLLGIDLGTSNLKAATFTPDGELIDQRSAPVREYQNGAARWQNADEWWRSAVELIRSLEPGRVEGVALSGRANAGVFLDRDLDVIVQPWADLRHRRALAALTRTDTHLSTYGAGLVSKINWLRDHQPHVYRRARYAAYAKDLLFLRLTGEHKTDWSSGPDQASWGSLEQTTLDLLPEPALPWDVGAGVRREAAQATGLKEGVPVAVGAHDGVAANVGVGATEPGTWALTLGTHAVVRAVVDEPHPFRFYVMPENRHVIGRTTLAAGRAIDWWCRTANLDRTKLIAAAQEAPAGAEGARFYPYLHGQIAPRLDRSRRGRLVGLTDRHDPAMITRAIIEGVSFGIAACADALAATIPRPTTIEVTGGGIQNRLWLQILADVLALPLNLGDAAVEARGACAYLAYGLGRYGSVEEAAATMRRTTGVMEPGAIGAEKYAPIRADWEKAETDDIAQD